LSRLEVTYFQEKAAFKVPLQAMMIAFLECHAWYMHTKDGTIYVPRKHLNNGHFSNDETYLYFSRETQLEPFISGGLDVVRRLISVIKDEVQAHNVVERFREWEEMVWKAVDELDSNIDDLPFLSIDLGDPAQRKSKNGYYPSTEDKAKLNGLIDLRLEHQEQTSTAVRRVKMDAVDTRLKFCAWAEGLRRWNSITAC